VTAFDLAGDLDEPLWQEGMTEADAVPPSLVAIGRDGRDFAPSLAQVLDVFPETPDPEIVVAFQHELFSQSAIRVYDLNGRLLDQFWHDGNPADMRWIVGERLLVVAGLNGEAYWPERGATEVGSTHYPTVLFAFQPDMEPVAPDWAPLPAPGIRSRIVWYRCLLPPSLAEPFHATDLRPPWRRDRDPRGRFRVTVKVRETPGAAVSMLMDADGREVPGHRVLTDLFAIRNDLPDPSALEFGDLPPIVTKGAAATEASTAAGEHR
jgi:hypothetical protein